MGFMDSVKGFIRNPVGWAANPTGMLGSIGGAALGGGLDYLSAEQQQRSNESMNQRNIELAREQMAAQKEFAQMGIRWRVEDATAAGLHPLAALGAAGAGYSPVVANLMGSESPKAAAFKSMGQNVSRAMSATATAEERLMQRLQLERASMENELLKARVVEEQRRVMNPGFPAAANAQVGLPGQGEARVGGSGGTDLPVQFMPMGTTVSPGGRAAQAYGHTTMYSYQRYPDGSLQPASSPDIQGDKANDVLSMLRHHIDMFAQKYTNPSALAPSYEDNPLPPHLYWKFRYTSGRFHPTPVPDKRFHGKGRRYLRPY